MKQDELAEVTCRVHLFDSNRQSNCQMALSYHITCRGRRPQRHLTSQSTSLVAFAGRTVIIDSDVDK